MSITSVCKDYNYSGLSCMYETSGIVCCFAVLPVPQFLQGIFKQSDLVY